MVEKTKLEELSSELPEEERKELLNKIVKRMKVEEKEEIVHVELQEEERQKLITEEIEHLSWWYKFLLWLRSFFTGKDKREAYLELKLAYLKRKINQVTPGLTGFETRNLTPKFAKALYDVYVKAYPLFSFFRVFSKDKKFRHSAFSFIVENKYEKTKKGLDDLITLDEMEEIYASTNFEEEIKKEVLKRLNLYLKSIPDSFFKELEESITALTYLEKFIFFPFKTFFQYFHYNLGDSIESKSPFFENAPVMLILDLLEKLYYSVYLVTRIPDDFVLNRDILRAYEFYRRDLEFSATDINAEDIDKTIDTMEKQIRDLIEAIKNFYKKIPLLYLIRYFRKDPYYRLMFNLPKLYIKALYAANLKEKLLQDLKAKLLEIKIRVIDRRIRELFKERKLLELFYYTENPNFDYRKLGLPYFKHIKSLTLLYNYLNGIYKGYIQEAIQLVNSYLLSNNRIVQNRMMQYAAGLEDLEAKIVLFDRSLSEDEEDGKTLVQFRYNLANDISLQKSYRAFVYQKDREALDLIEKGIEYLMGIKKIFDEMLTSPMESIKSTLKTLHVTRGKSNTLGQILRYRSDNISNFTNVMSQLLDIEKGS